ncbi:MAG: hypothetical protein QOJ93_81, partial [Actinomycetota bacterium]|nr:hypothetical protein [Actinomycetota bacterium]
VRIHEGLAADRMARAIGADAFAWSHHIFFRDGAYRPDTRDGLALLAHEATHTLQQPAVAAGSPTAGWSVSVPGDPWEREADLGAVRVLAGTAAPLRSPVQRSGPQVIQRHVSFEHRLLGDGPTADLVAISTGGPNRGPFLSNQIALLSKWKDNPTSVTEADVHGLCPWIRTLRIGPGNLLATYGELNALPDYLADAPAFDGVGPGILLPILQVIRQEGYNQLTNIATGTNPNVTFKDSASPPWKLSMLNALLETQALDELTFGLGPGGQDHYQGLLARNACHFAPFSWYRWQASHLIARDLAQRAHASKDPALTAQAWAYAGYADHFLQDSFAAGHLVNKTLVMQWFIEWAANQTLLPVADWESIKDMTVAHQPSLGGRWLYNPSYPGPSNDPQTAQEAATVVARILASGVVADGSTPQAQAYQNYLTFLTSAATQLASANLHDHYNEVSAWVSSIAHPAGFEVWGDDTLFTGANGGEGVQATSETAQMSQQALLDILNTGTTSITTEQIRQHFPTKAGSSATTLQDLQAWNDSQKQYCVDTSFPGFGAALKTILAALASPRLGIVSQDQEFASVWSKSLPRARFEAVNSLFAGDRLFVGSNGYVFELNPRTGSVIHSLLVTDSVGVGDYDTRLATDGTSLFVGVHGYIYGIALSDWSRIAWNVGVGGTGAYQPVSVLVSGSRLLAGSNGHVYEVNPTSGKIIHDLLVTSRFGTGNYETRLTTDGATLFVGVHGYVYGVSLSDWGSSKWDTGVGGTGAYQPVSVLVSGSRLFAGSNGYVYEINPASGQQLHSLLVTGSVGVGDYDTRLATDGATLFVGVHGYAYGVSLGDWSRSAWNVGLGSTLYHPVSVLSQRGHLFAGCNGYVYQIEPSTGRILHNLLLTYLVGVGEFDTRLASDGLDLFVGVHGYENRIQVRDSWLGGNLDHDWLDTQGAWHGWTGNFDNAPAKMESVAAAMGATAHLEVFAVGADGTLYHDWLDGQGAWHGWAANFDNAPAKMQSVSAAMGATGHLEVFAVGADGTLYHDWLDGKGTWHGWAANFDNAPAKMQSVSAVMGATNSLEVFAVGADGTLYHDWLDGKGAWHGWAANFDNAPAQMQSASAAMGATGHLEVFAVGADGTLYHDWLDGQGAWHGWVANFDNAPAKMQSATAVMGATKDLEVFAVGADGTLYHDWLDGKGGWHGWVANFDNAPAKMQSVNAAMGATGHLEVFAVGADGTLYHDWLDGQGAWHGWAPNFDNAPATVTSVTAVSGATGHLEVFAVRGS